MFDRTDVMKESCLTFLSKNYGGRFKIKSVFFWNFWQKSTWQKSTCFLNATVVTECHRRGKKTQGAQAV